MPTLSHADPGRTGSLEVALSTRLLGVWPADHRTHTGHAFGSAVERLVGMCVEEHLIPTGRAVIATFADRQEVLLAAWRLGVDLPDLLNLAEPIGFKRDRVFVGAVVTVRPFDLGVCADAA